MTTKTQTNDEWIQDLYKTELGRSADLTTPGGASYWTNKMTSDPTGHSRDEVARMIRASAEADSFRKTGKVNLGGVSRDSSTMIQGDKGQEYLDSFRGKGDLVGLNSADTLNKIAANTGQTGGYFQQSDQGIIDRIDKAVNPTTDPVKEDPVKEDPKKDGGMDDFMKFMMLMSVMGGGRGFGGGGGWGSQYGYGGLNPGGVQAAYNPWEGMQTGWDFMKKNFGGGVSGGSGLDVAKT